MGYFDLLGTVGLLDIQFTCQNGGNKNLQPKQNSAVSVFGRSSRVSSLILRELFADLTKAWKLKHLSEKVNCSIGQVSKVMDFLVKNAWAVKTSEGYAKFEPESVLKGME